MTETDAAANRASLVPGVHRLIRAVDAKDGPFAGTLVAFDETVAVCVDADELREWPGWGFSGSEHVCGVLDIRRRADGHDALLPWCVQRVEAFLGQRDASDAPLAPGELGTLVASLLRGVRELGADAEVVGDWWLTGDGRPMFVHGDGGTARARTAALIDRMVRQQTDRGTVRVLEEASAALRRPRHHSDEDHRWEGELFARAAPRALQLDVFAPERASDVTARLVAADMKAPDAESERRHRVVAEGRRTASRTRSAGSDDPASTRSRRTRSERRSRQGRSGEPWVPAYRARGESGAAGAAQLVRLAERVRARLERRREGRPADRHLRRVDAEARKPRPSRRRSALVAGAIGAAVLMTGLLWPSEPGDAPAEASSQEVSVEADAETGEDVDAAAPKTSTPISTPPRSQSAGGTALNALPALLDAISVCVQEGVEHCAAAVAEGARTPSDGVAVQGSSGSTSELVDDYGDVAVIRLTPIDSEGTEQMMVLEHRNEIWLVRDVYDVAHQPDQGDR